MDNWMHYVVTLDHLDLFYQIPIIPILLDCYYDAGGYLITLLQETCILCARLGSNPFEA